MFVCLAWCWVQAVFYRLVVQRFGPFVAAPDLPNGFRFAYFFYPFRFLRYVPPIRSGTCFLNSSFEGDKLQ